MCKRFLYICVAVCFPRNQSEVAGALLGYRALSRSDAPIQSRDPKGRHTSTDRTGNTSFSLTALSRPLKMSVVLRVRA